MRPSHALRALGLVSLVHAATKAPSKDAVLLSTVKTLTLRKGKSTTHRRVPAVPQIACAGGTASGLYEPDVIRCTNQGYDYDPESIQWTCTTSLPPEFKLGGTEVVCEGYRSSSDDWVLKGSCAVDYRLELTPVGEERWPDRVKSGWGFGRSKSNIDSEHWDRAGEGESKIPALLFWAVFIGIAGWIIYAAFIRDRVAGGPGGANRRRPGGGGGGNGGGWWPGGGGGGGWPGDDQDPPPPYSRHDRSKPSSSNPNQRGGGWQPGFWTGAASGAAATYLANNLAGRNTGGRGAFNRGYDAGVGPSNGGPSRSGSSNTSSGSPSYSSSRYESSGFGGTSRR